MRILLLALPALLSCGGGDCPSCEGAVELCDGVDNDLDGAVDEAALDAPTWYADLDGDGHGGEALEAACEAPPGALASGGDCDDADPSVHPSAVEDCDGVDDDCSGAADDAASAGWTTDAGRWEQLLDVGADDTFTWMSRFARDPSTGDLFAALSAQALVDAYDSAGRPETVAADVHVSLVELTGGGPVLHDLVLSEPYAMVQDLAVSASGEVWLAWQDIDRRAHLTRWSRDAAPSTTALAAYGDLRLEADGDGVLLFVTAGSGASTALYVLDETGATRFGGASAGAGKAVLDVAWIGDELWVAGAEEGGDLEAVLWRWTGSGLEELNRLDYNGEDRFHALAPGPDGQVWLSWTLESTDRDLWSILTLPVEDPSDREVADAVDFGAVRIDPSQIDVHPFAGAVAGAWINTFSVGGLVRVGPPDGMADSLSLPYDLIDGLGVDSEGSLWVASRFSTILDSRVSLWRLSCLD